MVSVSFEVRRSIDATAKEGFEGLTYESALKAFRAIDLPIDRYMYLRTLFDKQTDVYYTLLLKRTEEILPFIYTPTVGEACQKYHTLPLKTHGLYISLADKGKVLDKLRAWPQQDVRVIVATDGERILGLGDLGANGMGISEGKITLYTAAAGLDPTRCLPVCLDVGTNNTAYLQDPLYKGLRQKRPSQQEFDELMAEFVAALKAWRPHVLVQWEDFGNNNAFRVLERYRGEVCSFNDDIQGTAAITLAALMAALRYKKHELAQQRILFLGAGEAGTGIGDLIAHYLVLRCGLPLQQARERCLFLDSKGLVCKSRTGLQHHKQPFAHDVPFQPDLKSAIRAFKPDAIIGVSTMPGAFDQEVVQLMLEYTQQPIIFPLSNPTSKAECTYEQAFNWTSSQVIFASGSPFAPIMDAACVLHHPAQANNAYIFPAVGMAAVLTRCSAITDEVFVVAAEALADMAVDSEVAVGRLFPAFSNIRHVSKVLAAKVADFIVASGLGSRPADCEDWMSYVERHMWHIAQEASKI